MGFLMVGKSHQGVADPVENHREVIMRLSEFGIYLEEVLYLADYFFGLGIAESRQNALISCTSFYDY